MIRFKPSIYSALFVICVLLIGLAWICLRRQGAPQDVRTAPLTPEPSQASSAPNAPGSSTPAALSSLPSPTAKSVVSAEAAAVPEKATTFGNDLSKTIGTEVRHLAIPDLYCIFGAVVDITPDTSDEMLTELASVGVDSEEKYVQALQKIFIEQPVPNAIVTLRGKSVTRETVGDPEGNFKFPNVLGGDYELFAEKPGRSSMIGGKRIATARSHILLDRPIPGVRLELRTDYVTIKGRITDMRGWPIAGAKVIGMEVVDAHTGSSPAPISSTISKADGSYELRELKPSDIYKIAVSLAGGSLGDIAQIDVRAQADGFLQDMENVPRVPLVTMDILGPARRLLKAMSETIQRATNTELREKEGVSLPSSQGNTITGIDIVLKRVN